MRERERERETNNSIISHHMNSGYNVYIRERERVVTKLYYKRGVYYLLLYLS